MNVYGNTFGVIRRGRRPRRPEQNRKFAQNSVNERMQSYVFATQIFYVFRVAREVDPYDRAGCNALNSCLRE